MMRKSKKKVFSCLNDERWTMALLCNCVYAVDTPSSKVASHRFMINFILNDGFIDFCYSNKRARFASFHAQLSKFCNIAITESEGERVWVEISQQREKHT